jgi:hypothetical protein
MRLTRQASLTALALLLFVPVIGCGKGKSDVSGTVNLDGKPVADGTIVFHPTDGVAVSAGIKDGKYMAPKVPRGEASVTVNNTEIKLLAENPNRFASDTRATGTAGALPPGVELPPAAKADFEKRAEILKRTKEQIANYREIPAKYNDPAASGLKFKVGSSSTFDVDLKSK